MQYYAHGKLLFSGEYLVLKGARALAIPSRFGQSLSFTEGDDTLHWRSFDNEGNLWFEASFSTTLEIVSTSSTETAVFLTNILSHAEKLAGKSIATGKIETHLEFPRDWGLGSSSTLTYLIAQWMQVDPFELLFATQNGSGYDIACASATGSIIYTKTTPTPLVENVTLPSVFEDVFFIHLNKKQNSRPAVTNFLKGETDPLLITKVSELTKEMLEVKSTAELQNVMEAHEALMASVLKTPTVKSQLFSDFEGSVKSLGAWGGDFVMAIGNDVEHYFSKKGYQTILPFGQMI